MIESSKLDIKLNHRNWEHALSFSFSLLISACPGEVVCICGPSRAGKTRLVYELIQLLSGQSHDKHYNPYTCISVLAENVGTYGSFSTKAFTFQLFEALDHPIITLAKDDIAFASKFDRLTETAMRQPLKRAFKHRGVRYLFIDEAQHVKYTTNASLAPHAVLDSWKSLAASAGIVLVIVGAYPILNVMQKSSHLIGRTKTVHLPRYYANQEDLKHFYSIAYAFLNELSRAGRLDLKKHISDLYDRTFGCIGLLRSWLISANDYAIATDSTINSKVLRKTAHPKAFLEPVWNEIHAGEAILDTLDEKIFVNANNNSTSKEKSPSKTSKPFQRNPDRYEAGNRI